MRCFLYSSHRGEVWTNKCPMWGLNSGPSDYRTDCQLHQRGFLRMEDFFCVIHELMQRYVSVSCTYPHTVHILWRDCLVNIKGCDCILTQVNVNPKVTELQYIQLTQSKESTQTTFCLFLSRSCSQLKISAGLPLPLSNMFVLIIITH